MGLLDRLTGRKPKVTKVQVAERLAGAIAFVLRDAGVEMLYAGTLVLDRSFNVGFRSGRPSASSEQLAAIPVASLPTAANLRAASASPTAINMYVDELAWDVLRELEASSVEFRRLDEGNMLPF